MRGHPRYTLLLSLVLALHAGELLRAEPPTASHIFPPGGRRGTTVAVRVGGLYLNSKCGFEMLGAGVEVNRQLQRMPTLWFEGPLLPLPDSQQQEDYPQDMRGSAKIAADAPLGPRPWRLWTSQGATPHLKFIVGDLPETVEREIEGTPVPVEVPLPVTINGRIFPRENIDIWTFAAKKGQSIVCEVCAARLGSPLDSRIEVRDPEGRFVAENDDYFGADSFLRFTAAADGRYQVRIHDVNFRGGPAYVYRLTLTADPYVDRVYPLGGRRGTDARFEVSGQGVAMSPLSIPLPADGPADYAHRLTVDGKLTNPFALELDDLPEHVRTEAAQPQQVEAPCIVNGRIDKAGTVDAWLVPLRKGEVCEFDLRAQRLGSPLHAVLTIRDPLGKDVGRTESGENGQADPILRFTPPADGTYTVHIGERFRGRGGPAHAYRLRIAPQTTPDFRLSLGGDALTLPRNGQAKLKVLAERRGNFAEPIALTIDGLPSGVTATGTTIAAKQNVTEIVLKADAAATIQAPHLTIRGSAKIGDQAVTRTAILSPGRGVADVTDVLLAIALPTPFKIIGDHEMRWGARGGMHQRRFRMERNGFAGPIEVRLADKQARHLQGVTASPMTVPADAAEFDYLIQLPPWMETGRTCRVCVMGTALVKDADGSEHEVTYSSVQPNEQFIIVVEPERLSLSSGRRSLTAVPGETVSVPLQVGRGRDLKGTVKVEVIFAAHIHGITAQPVEFAADADKAVLSLRFAADVRGPFNAPLLLRATLLDQGRPVIAETKLDLVTPEK